VIVIVIVIDESVCHNINNNNNNNNIRVRVVSIESSLGARLQVSHVQEERAGSVHDSRHGRWSDDGMASERGDVRDLSSSLSVALSRELHRQ